VPWAIKMRSENRLDGKREWFLGRYVLPITACPTQLDGHKTAVFRTRKVARQFVNDTYGHLRDRPDLRAEPHGWKPPHIVRVNIEINEVRK